MVERNAAIRQTQDMNIDSILSALVSNDIGGRMFLLALITLAGLFFGKISRRGLHRVAEHLETRQPSVVPIALRALARSAPCALLIAALGLGAMIVKLESIAAPFLMSAVDALLIVAVARICYALVDVVDYWLISVTRRTDSRLDDMLIPLVRKSIRLVVIALAVFQVATVWSDKPITSILAGLGVGGLAVALAAQETIKNFFGSLVIFGDKPFEIGDRIVVDGFDGPVEAVGFRSTRIRTLEGHLVTVPNGELANKTIQNIGKRPNIRQLFSIGLVYETSHSEIREALRIVRELLENHEGMSEDFPPRVFFSSFGDWSLNISVIYWYHPADYWSFVSFHESLLLAIKERFEAAKLSFAFPSRTVYLKQEAEEKQA